MQRLTSPGNWIYIFEKLSQNNDKWRSLLNCNDPQKDALDSTPLCKYPEGGINLQSGVLDGTPLCKHPESEFAFPQDRASRHLLHFLLHCLLHLFLHFLLHCCSTCHFACYFTFDFHLLLHGSTKEDTLAITDCLLTVHRLTTDCPPDCPPAVPPKAP